jgi:hypothetical protein
VQNKVDQKLQHEGGERDLTAKNAKYTEGSEGFHGLGLVNGFFASYAFFVVKNYPALTAVRAAGS